MTARRPVAPKVRNSKSAQSSPPVKPASPTSSASLAKPKAPTTSIKPQPAKSQSTNAPKGTRSEANPKLPNRVSIHARPENVRKRLDSLEAVAQANSMPEALTIRTLVSAVMVLLVAALLIPTMRGAFEQSQHLAELRNHLEQSQAVSEQLDADLARWEDPVFIESEARSRLGFVRPGDRVWRTIGGETLFEDVDPVTGMRVDVGVVGTTAGQPWFDSLLESFLVANGPVEPNPDDLNEVLNRARTD